VEAVVEEEEEPIMAAEIGALMTRDQRTDTAFTLPILTLVPTRGTLRSCSASSDRSRRFGWPDPYPALPSVSTVTARMPKRPRGSRTALKCLAVVSASPLPDPGPVAVVVEALTPA
jgi:hypothetical protein